MDCSILSSSVLLYLLAATAAVSLFMSNSVWPHERQPTRLRRPSDFPGKNTGVGCHFLLQCMKVKSESKVAQSYPTLWDPMDCSLPGFSVHRIFQARVLEWVAIAFSDISWSLLKFMSIELVMLSSLYHHPLPRPSPLAVNLSQHQGLSQWISCLHHVAEVLELQLQDQFFHWIFRVNFL